MPRNKKRRTAKQTEQHSFLTAKVESCDISAEAAINSAIYSPDTAWLDDDGDLLYQFTAMLTLEGRFEASDERTGHGLDLTIYGNDAPSRSLSETLSDVQERDAHGSRQYRKYRGRDIPVYRAVHGLATMDKLRGEQRWHCWLQAPTRFVHDLLAILDQERVHWLAIHEVKVNRQRWVRRISLQTTDPSEE